MKHESEELRRAEKVNKYGVKLVNRLVELRTIFPSSGKVYKREYVWYQDIIQPSGEAFTSVNERYERFNAMERKMKRFNFDIEGDAWE